MVGSVCARSRAPEHCGYGAPITDDDDEWVEALRDLLDDGQIDGTWSLHLAAGGRVVPLVNGEFGER